MPGSKSRQTDTLTAALAYADRGWYVLPVLGATASNGNDAKKPATSEVGRWSDGSTREPDIIAGWFTGTGYGVAVDLARSNLTMIDIDTPEAAPADLLHLAREGVARTGNPEREAYLFTGTLPQARHDWGDVKSAGGYIVLPPSYHPIAGRYRWGTPTWDTPPPIPDDLAALVAPTTSDGGGRAYTGADATDEQIKWAMDLLGRQADRLSNAPQGQRNNLLNVTAMILGHYVPHLLDEEVVWDALWIACQNNGLALDDGQRACRLTFLSGIDAGKAQPQVPQMSEGQVLDIVTVGHDEGLFTVSEQMEHLRTAARARMVSPWAVLGAALAIVVAETPARVHLPAMVGGEVGINLYVALTGGPGTGKSSAYRVARAALLSGEGRAERAGPGSGEGLIDSFTRYDKDLKMDVLTDWPNVILYADEVEHLGAVGGRAGGTIESFLRTMWTGGDVATSNTRTGGKRRSLQALTYRLAVVAGVQPRLATVLLDNADAGTPQRWLWVPTRDINMPDVAPEWPGTLGWTPPVVSGAVIGVTHAIQDHIRQAHRARVKGTATGDDLSEHMNLSQLKVASALALLHGEDTVGDTYWAWAGRVIEVSNGTRGMAAEAVVAAALEDNRAKGVSQARRDEAADAYKQARASQRLPALAALVARQVHAGAGQGHATMRHAVGRGCSGACLAHALRNHGGRLHRDEAAEYAEAEGWIVQRDDRWHPGDAPPTGDLFTPGTDRPTP